MLMSALMLLCLIVVCQSSTNHTLQVSQLENNNPLFESDIVINSIAKTSDDDHIALKTISNTKLTSGADILTASNSNSVLGHLSHDRSLSQSDISDTTIENTGSESDENSNNNGDNETIDKFSRYLLHSVIWIIFGFSLCCLVLCLALLALACHKFELFQVQKKVSRRANNLANKYGEPVVDGKFKTNISSVIAEDDDSKQEKLDTSSVANLMVGGAGRGQSKLDKGKLDKGKGQGSGAAKVKKYKERNGGYTALKQPLLDGDNNAGGDGDGNHDGKYNNNNGANRQVSKKSESNIWSLWGVFSGKRNKKNSSVHTVFIDMRDADNELGNVNHDPDNIDSDSDDVVVATGVNNYNFGGRGYANENRNGNGNGNGNGNKNKNEINHKRGEPSEVYTSGLDAVLQHVIEMNEPKKQEKKANRQLQNGQALDQHRAQRNQLLQKKRNAKNKGRFGNKRNLVGVKSQWEMDDNNNGNNGNNNVNNVNNVINNNNSSYHSNHNSYSNPLMQNNYNYNNVNYNNNNYNHNNYNNNNYNNNGMRSGYNNQFQNQPRPNNMYYSNFNYNQNYNSSNPNSYNSSNNNNNNNGYIMNNNYNMYNSNYDYQSNKHLLTYGFLNASQVEIDDDDDDIVPPIPPEPESESEPKLKPQAQAQEQAQQKPKAPPKSPPRPNRKPKPPPRPARQNLDLAYVLYYINFCMYTMLMHAHIMNISAHHIYYPE